MTETPWPSEWLRGVLTLCVMRAMTSGPTYGYAIASELERLGLGAVKGGTLYPLLTRLEESGLVTTSWQPGDGGPGRKFFELNDAGRAELERLTAEWSRFATLTTSYLNPLKEIR
ncbi:MAG: PadR family transcriptional regulator [Propionibacteriaceae bacterium]|mgnify:CR=1 FL=1|nr:PadR family transcriptional regulator [Micropruina sp.]HBX81587.1 PadR family transcriptional regulator [Propionibacteriaceae bacterium]